MERGGPFSATFGGGQEDSLIFFGQGAELAYAMAEGDNAEERALKAYLGDPSGERGLTAARRRVVRRPLGSGYPANTIVFSERERDGTSPTLSSEPLSELLQQLAASRKGQQGSSVAATLRGAREAAAGGSLLSSITAGLEASGKQRAAGAHGASDAAPTPEQVLRAGFVQEVMLSALAQSVGSLDYGPLDRPPVAAAARRPPGETL